MLNVWFVWQKRFGWFVRSKQTKCEREWIVSIHLWPGIIRVPSHIQNTRSTSYRWTCMVCIWICLFLSVQMVSKTALASNSSPQSIRILNYDRIVHRSLFSRICTIVLSFSFCMNNSHIHSHIHSHNAHVWQCHQALSGEKSSSFSCVWHCRVL